MDRKKRNVVFNRIVIMFLIIISLFGFFNVAKAEVINEPTDEVRLQLAIQESIDKVLKEYIDNAEVNYDVKGEINKAVAKLFTEMNKADLEQKVKESIKNALSGNSAQLASIKTSEDMENLQNRINSSDDTLKNNLAKVQEMFSKLIEDKTYEYAINLFDPKVAEEIGVQMRKAIKKHNEDCYSSYGDGRTILIRGAQLISEEEEEKIISNVVNNVKNYTTSGLTLSSTIKTDVTEPIALGNLVVDYLYTNSEVVTDINNAYKNEVGQNDSIAENIDRLAPYIKGNEIIERIKSGLDIQVTEELKTILENSVKDYLTSSSGAAIFNDIKTGIYYYIKDNGGYDKVINDGFSDKAMKYITDQITKIIGGNISTKVSSYISTLVEEKLDYVIVDEAYKCVYNGVDQLIRESVPYGISKKLDMELSELLEENLVRNANTYLKNLVNNQKLKNFLNSQFVPYKNNTIINPDISTLDYATEILYNVGTEIISDDGEGRSYSYEVDTECLKYVKNTLFDTIINGIIAGSQEYMNGENGKDIIKIACKNVYDTLMNEIEYNLILQVNTVMENWINAGIVTDIWNAIKLKVELYLDEIENNPTNFQSGTGILLGDILKEIRFDSTPLNGQKISLEDLSNMPNLISSERGAVIVPRHSYSNRYEDATVEVGVINLFEQLVEDRGKSMIVDPSYSSTGLMNPFAVNPYGITKTTPLGTFGVPGPAGVSRTIAKYSTARVRNLTVEEAYILAHEKETGYYPDYVQSSYWQLDGKSGPVDKGIVDSKTLNTIFSLLRVASSIYNNWDSVLKTWDFFANFTQNLSNIGNQFSTAWNNLSFAKIAEGFKSINFKSILDSFSISGWFEGFTLTNFFDNMCKIENLQKAGFIVDALVNNNWQSGAFSTIGGLIWKPFAPILNSINGEDWIKLYQNVGAIWDGAQNLMYGSQYILNEVAERCKPTEREIVDGKQPQDVTKGIELYSEAEGLKMALERYDGFNKANGKNLVDTTDYSKVEVSYSKNTDEIVVGPFSVDYIREFYSPLFANNSQMTDYETGIISYTGIIDAKLYADDNKTIEIPDWKFVYPDKDRTGRSPFDLNYEYPYPNEVFYLQFSSMDNYSVNTLSKMQFVLEKMDADGQVYELEGKYDQLMWVGVDVPIVCPCPPLRCAHGVLFGHLIWPTGWCPTVLCAIHKVGAAPLPYHLALNGHLFGHVYYCQAIPLGTGLHAMDLEQVVYSKIYKEYEYVDIELGEKKPYYVQSVNTTQYMVNSVNKGNITEEVDSVPVLPFLPNYDTYPGYPNYPDYAGNPNYPDNAYTFNNEEYKDYPSYPLYTGKGPGGDNDPTYPYYPDDEVIPLTFHVSGTVWLDNPSGKEVDADGIKADNERGIPNIEVILYKKGDTDYIAKTLTDENGYYIFEYVRVGFDYYVEFAYDGMTYKTTEYLQSDIKEHGDEDLSEQTQKYRLNPENYLTSSHAIEDVAERDAFNDKFYHISENVATANDESKSQIALEYKNWKTPNGTVSTMITTDKREITKQEFKMYARSAETDLYFPVDNQYQVEYYDLDLYRDGTDYYKHTYPCLEHINLGLIQREQGDFATKTDTYQVITTLKEDTQKYKYDDKNLIDNTYNILENPSEQRGTNIDDNTFDILCRTGDYYTAVPYNQELNPDDCGYRFDSTYGDNKEIVATVLTEKDELNAYIEYKIIMKNRATLEAGRLIEVENSFDQDLEYMPKYDFTDLSSWIEIPMTGTSEIQRKEVLWEYREGTENGYSTIYTDDLADKSLAPGEQIEVHLILRVKKDNATDRNLRMDFAPNEYKEDITEITVYSYDEGLMDKTSNPGSARLGDTRTYADGTDPSPLFKLIYDRDYDVLNSNTIQGYAWEDLVVDRVSQNNQLISNGKIDADEKKINNVKVELVEVVTDKETGKEVEVIRKTASGTDYYLTGEDINVAGQVIDIQDGEYKFLRLETGMYRVKFTYGDEYQLTKDLTYNAQDYKTVSLDTIYQQYYNKDLELMLMLDTSSSMSTDSKGNLMREAITPLVYDLYKNIQKVKIGAYMFSEPGTGNFTSIGLTEKPNLNSLLNLYANEKVNVGKTLADTIYDALGKFNKKADGKVIAILTDGYMTQSIKDKKALQAAEKAGVKVITIACATDEWDASTFGTESQPTTGILYNVRHKNCAQYVSEVLLEDILVSFENVLPNLTDAKDVEYSYLSYRQSALVEDIYSRKHNIDYSSTMVNANAEVLDLQNIKNVQNQLEKEINKSADKQDAKLIESLKADIASRIKTLAENTKVVAITPNRNITFLPEKEKTQNVNLGLVERPQVELKVEEKISNIQVKLANGEVVIDTSKDLNKNVQEIKNDKFSIFMDEEIMQGATLNVQYKITVTNNGQVDTLADYFTYDMFNPEETYFATTTVANAIGTIYDYFTNNTFRAEDNNNLDIEINDVILKRLQYDGVTIKNWEELVDKNQAPVRTITPEISAITTRKQDDGRAAVLKEKVDWALNKSITLNSNAESKIDEDEIKTVESKSLKNIPIYPNISKEALSKTGVSSISFYVNYSKQLSGNDKTDSLHYKNSTEIVERLNAVGRRDYKVITGNYEPQTNEDLKEYDSAYAEEVIILPPFGENKEYTGYIILAIGAIILFIGGVIFIKKKVM